MTGRIVPVVLAGGAGTRLWPLSTPERPKPLLDLLGEGPMLAVTVRRLDGLGAAAPLVVGSATLAPALRATLDAAGLGGTVVAEPAPRATASALCAAAALCDDEDLLVVLPADHHVADAHAFRTALGMALRHARRGSFALLGVRPDRVEPGFGHVRAGPLDDGAHRVLAFVEKPPPARAAALTADGRHLWNAGVFVVRVDVVRALALRLLPDVFDAVEQAVADAHRAPGVLSLGAAFARAPAVSIDEGLAERVDDAVVVPLDAGWSDVGTFRALHAALPHDAAGNAVRGDVVLEDCRDCLALALDGPLVLRRQRGVLVVRTASATLTAPLEPLPEFRR